MPTAHGLLNVLSALKPNTSVQDFIILFHHLNPISYPQICEEVEIPSVPFLPDTRFLKMQGGHKHTQPMCKTEICDRLREKELIFILNVSL